MRVFPLSCAAVLCATSLFAQNPVPQFDAVTSGPAAQITSNARWVYVLAGGQLHQFDAETLQWKRSVALPGRPGMRGASDPVVTLEDVTNEVRRNEPRPERPDTKPVTRAIAAGVQWLLGHQEEDGHWSAQRFWTHDAWKSAVGDREPAGEGRPVHDVAVTSLSLLALLADGSTMKAGPHKDAIVRAVKWLRTQQDPESGLLGAKATNEFIYDHAIGTLALCEAAGLSGSKLIRGNAQKAINYLEYHRNPYGVWRYEPKGGDNDTSVTGWCTLAYKSAMDHGFEVNPQAMKVVGSWVDSMTDAETGRVGYIERGGWSSRMPGDHAVRFPREKNETMTAVGLMLRFLVDAEPRSDRANRGAKLLVKKRPRWDAEAGTVDHIGWYFGTMAMYQRGGDDWNAWREALIPALVESQRRETRFAGSWDPKGPWGTNGGRVMSTALGVLTLRVEERRSRIIR